MGPQRLSNRIKDDIHSKASHGWSLHQIAQELSLPYSTVQRFLVESPVDMPVNRGGRPASLTPGNSRWIIRQVTSGQAKTAVEGAKMLESHFNVKVTPRTIRNALHKAGLTAVERPIKPKITARQAKERYAFALAHQDWTIVDWSHVIWSDETKINRFCSDGRSYAWIRDGEALKPSQLKQTVKHGGGSVMIWGCMTYEGIGYMCRIEGTMDKELYKTILEDDLLGTIDYYGFDSSHVIFQQDNDPKHTAKTVKEWLGQQEFNTLEWPASSPDLNPIEHLWAHLKMQLSKFDTPPKGMLELWERVEQEWDKISPDVCKNLIDSMPRRIEAVIKSKGWWTDY
jgi:transposase